VGLTTEKLAPLCDAGGRRGGLTKLAKTFAVRSMLRALSLGAVVVIGTVAPSSAQQIKDVFANAVVVPANLSPTLRAERLGTPANDLRPSFDATQPAAPELTQALLQSYVERQKELKQFDGFLTDPKQTLTTDVLLGYIARTQITNSALDAIADAAVESKPALTPDVLANYVDKGFVPTARRLKLADDERLCLTQAIYHEARGESLEGQIAVANIIINRAFSGKYPSTICGVVFQNADKGRYRCQFTFACDGRSDLGTDRRAWKHSEELAERAYHEFVVGERPGVLPDTALFYHTRAVAPNWSRVFKRVATIGSHIFYAAR